MRGVACVRSVLPFLPRSAWRLVAHAWCVLLVVLRNARRLFAASSCKERHRSRSRKRALTSCLTERLHVLLLWQCPPELGNVLCDSIRDVTDPAAPAIRCVADPIAIQQTRKATSKALTFSWC
eukprot:352186-Chlamydomonas_euryale.AAC.10